MSLPFISQRERVTVTEYQRVFDRIDCPGAGWSFECTASGEILRDKLQPAGRESLRKCLDGTYPVRDTGVHDCSHSYWEPASVRCDCGNQVWLEDAMTNACERCGQLINGCGQRLAPEALWEERYDDDY